MPPPQDSTTQQAFIGEVAPGAVAAQRRYGVPAAVTIAQAIDESGWGQSSLASRDNNLFGIKGSGPAGSAQLPTQEYENGKPVTRIAGFRVYHNVAESINDHGKLLATSGYYQQSMAERRDPNAFASALTGVYATDPNYGATLIGLMRKYDLYRYDAGTLAAAGGPATAAGATPAGPAPASAAPASATPASATPGGATPGGATPAGVSPGGASPGDATPAGANPGGANSGGAGPGGATPGGGGTGGANPGGANPGGANPGGATPGRPSPGRSTPGGGGTGGANPGGANPGGASPGGAMIAGRRHAAPAPQESASPPAPSPSPTPAAGVTPGPDRTSGSGQSQPGAMPSTQTVTAKRMPGPAGRSAPRSTSRKARPKAAQYRQPIPPAVRNSFTTLARVPLMRAEPLYRDVASHTGIRWELLAACDWMQCQARPRCSPVHGEKLGTVNPDGSIYRTKSAALEQCADDLVTLAGAVYRIDLAAPGNLSVRDLANAFAAFRWGGLLRLHHTSAMEFPYSVAGLTAQHMNMRWPGIAEPNAPDKPGRRFRMPFGAVPVVLSLDYPATI